MVRNLIVRAGRAYHRLKSWGKAVTAYSVEFEEHGRSGTVRYSEGTRSLAFW